MKSNILVLNLCSQTEVLLSQKLISALKYKYPTAKIATVVFRDTVKTAKSLTVDAIFEIDRERILTLKNNPIFSDAHSLNCFSEQIEILKKQHWDLLINTNDNNLSAYIAAYIDVKMIDGIRFDQDLNKHYSNTWAMINSEVLANFKFSPISKIDGALLACELNEGPHEEFQLKKIQKFEEKAEKNLTHLRRSVKQKDFPLYLVGLEIRTSEGQSPYSRKTIIELLDQIFDDPTLYPILFVPPGKESAQLASEINIHFDNKLVTIESDILGLPAVLSRIDLLISSGELSKQVAELVSTPIIQVNAQNSICYNQGPRGRYSYNLTDPSMTANNIFEIIRLYFNQQDLKTLNLVNDAVLSKPMRDSLGIQQHTLKGHSIVTDEITRVISRYYINFLATGKEDLSVLRPILQFEDRYLKDWILGNKKQIYEISKIVLSALRVIANQNTSGEKLTHTLERLFDFLNPENQKLASIPVFLFQAKAEQIGGMTFEKAIKHIEKQIYALKNALQQMLEFLNRLESSDTTFVEKTRKSQTDDSAKDKSWSI